MSWRDEYTREDLQHALAKVGLAKWADSEDRFTIWSDGSITFEREGEITSTEIEALLSVMKPKAWSVHNFQEYLGNGERDDRATPIKSYGLNRHKLMITVSWYAHDEDA